MYPAPVRDDEVGKEGPWRAISWIGCDKYLHGGVKLLCVLDCDEPEYTFFEWEEKALDVLFLP